MRFALLFLILLAPPSARAGIAAEKAALEKRFGPLEDVATTHLTPAPNDTARTLEELAARLEIDLVPKSREGRPKEKKKTKDLVEEERKKWYASVLQEPDDVLGTAPDEVLAWHVANRATIDEVRHVLLTWKPPEWEQDLSDPAKAPIPNLLGVMNLWRVLIGDALIAEAAGDSARAESDLEAAWALSTSLLGRADTISVLIAIAGARGVAIAVRKLHAPTPAWRDRLDAAPFRAAMLTGVLAEARFFIGLVEGKFAHASDKEHGRVLRWVQRRAEGVVLSGQIEDYRLIAEELAGEPRCEHSEKRATGDDFSLFGITIPNLRGYGASLVPRVDALGLHFEMTRRVMDVREVVAETGTLPALLPGGKSTTSCPSHAWRWKVDGGTGHLEPVRLGETGVGKWWVQTTDVDTLRATIGVP